MAVYVVVVTVRVVKEHVEEFVAATVANAEGTRKEPGNLRFDVLRADSDEDGGAVALFQLVEAYRTPEDFAAHQQTPHYLAWRAAVAPWMAQPRSAVKTHAVWFGDAKCC